MRLKSARNIHIISVLKIYFQKWGGGNELAKNVSL